MRGVKSSLRFRGKFILILKEYISQFVLGKWNYIYTRKWIFSHLFFYTYGICEELDRILYFLVSDVSTA